MRDSVATPQTHGIITNCFRPVSFAGMPQVQNGTTDESSTLPEVERGFHPSEGLSNQILGKPFPRVTIARIGTG